ncbi:MAG: discoidin domain-containing protein [Firmicutes bacterium]|nr:discoidin domain-containing protein [Bacillota bacterium]
MRTVKCRLLSLTLAFLLCVGMIPLSFILVGAEEAAEETGEETATGLSFDEKNIVETLFDASYAAENGVGTWVANSDGVLSIAEVDGTTVLQHETWASGSVTFKRSLDIDWSEHDYENIKVVAYVYIDIEGEDSSNICEDGYVTKGKFEIRCVDSAGNTTNRYIADATDGLVLHTGWNAIELTLDEMPIHSADSASTQETGYTTTNEFCFYLTANAWELSVSLASAYIIDTSYDNTATETDLSDYIIANISFASADDLSGGGATATAVGDGMTYDDGESVTMTDGASYFTVAKDDGTALLEGLTEVTISFDANTTGDLSWAFEVTSETEHTAATEEHYIGCLISGGNVQVERYNNTEGRPDAASGSTTNDTWVHYDCIFYADGCTAVYVDGELVSIVAQSDGFDLSLANCIGEDSTFYVGYAAWGEYFSGSLKNLVVYSTAIYEHTDDSTENLDGIGISGTEISIISVIDDGNGTYEDSEDTTSDHVFDGDTSTYYDGAVEDAWVGCTFDSTVISTVLVYARTDLYERMSEAEIQGSNDGESWTTLYTITEEENAEGQWIVCDITDTTAYTYLRIYGCGYGNVAEMKLYAATDDSAGYTLVSGAEVSILSVIDDGNGPWDDDTERTSDHVFDGDTSTFYDGAAEDAWVGCTFDSTVISAVALYPRSDEECYSRLEGAVIQGSNDGESWTDLYTIDTVTLDEWIVCDITDTTAYTYLRIYGCEYGNVAEMRIYTAYGVTDGLVGYYTLTSDLSNSVEGGSDGSAVGHMFGNTEGDADFTDGSFHTTNGVNDGAVFTADITDDFTVSFTVSVDWYAFAAPILWIGSQDQSSENWIGIWCDFNESYGPSVGSNGSEEYRIGVMGGTSVGVTYPVTDLIITLVVEDGVAYLYYDGVLVGQSNDPENGAFQSDGNNGTDLTTSSMPNP